MSNVLSKIMDGVKAVAPTVANLVVPGSGPQLHSIMRAVTGEKTADIEQVAQMIDQNPELFLQVQNQAMAHEVQMARVEVSRLEAVNKTMQTESKSEHWPQWLWRPFNGFLFGLAVVLIYFVLPLAGKTIPEVPQWIWLGWGAILGVTTWDRGKEKRARAGEQRTGLLAGAIKAIRGQ